jgi:hypothetical protein
MPRFIAGKRPSGPSGMEREQARTGAPRTTGARSGRPSPAGLLAVHQAVGNRAFGRMMRSAGPPTMQRKRATQSTVDSSMRPESGRQRAESEPRSKENTTGLPDALKAELENLSGISLDAVRVHYHSAEPAEIAAVAYAEGLDIHIGPGQERHLPHEAWHVVQQLQGRVRPTSEVQGIAINADVDLEREADVMGERATRSSREPGPGESREPRQAALRNVPVVQRLHEDLVQEGGFKAEKGRAENSKSLAGASRKPLAVIPGVLRIGGVDQDVEIHVHLNANNPLSTFSGANVRFQGAPSGFAYWSADTVDSHRWLKEILDTGLPDWSKKATWEKTALANQIVWQGPVGAGWKFDEAARAAHRRSNAHYVVKFTVTRVKALDFDVSEDDAGRKSKIAELLGPRISAISTKKSADKTLVTLVYLNEQVAQEQLDEDAEKLQRQWSSSKNFTHKPTNAW